jgi:hypothetical protein
MDTPQQVITDLHFQTGVPGRVARFVVRCRAAEDPFDATAVLPLLIFIALLRLNELGRVNESIVFAGMVIPAVLAGAWMVIRLGSRGYGRAMLRGAFVGLLQAMALAIFVKEAQSKAIEWAGLLMWLNFTYFWIGAHLLGSPFDTLTVTEADWQKAAPLRAKIEQITRLVFKIKDGVPTLTGLLVVAIRVLGPVVLAAYGIWAFGGNPWDALKSLLHLPG